MLNLKYLKMSFLKTAYFHHFLNMVINNPAQLPYFEKIEK